MIITINLQKTDELEEILLDSGITPVTTKIGYDWAIQGENSNESIEDLQLFCVSIVKDLIKTEFNASETEAINDKFDELFENEDDDDETDDETDDDDEDDYFSGTEFVTNSLEYLFNIIALKKIKNAKTNNN